MQAQAQVEADTGLAGYAAATGLAIGTGQAALAIHARLAVGARVTVLTGAEQLYAATNPGLFGVQLDAR